MTYLIQYIIHNDRNGVVANGKIKVKNSSSEGDAMNKLRKHMNEKYWDLHKLEMWVLKEPPPVTNPLNSDPFDMFSTIFGKK